MLRSSITYTENFTFLGHDVLYIGIYIPTLGYPKNGRNQFSRNFSVLNA
jgi:hypothetical protein